MQKRAHVRAIPRTPVTVAFDEGGEPLAYGAVANISEGGACVWTSAHFEVGQRLSVRLSASRRPQPLESPAVVVWEAGEKNDDERSHRYGLRWSSPSPEYRSQLLSLFSH